MSCFFHRQRSFFIIFSATTTLQHPLKSLSFLFQAFESVTGEKEENEKAETTDPETNASTDNAETETTETSEDAEE